VSVGAAEVEGIAGNRRKRSQVPPLALSWGMRRPTGSP
jgi:hypothetical protein